MTELSNEVRAELVARTGHDIRPDDPVMVLVALNQILLPKLASEVTDQMVAGVSGATAALEEMRKETLKSAAEELLAMAGQAKDSLRVDFGQAEGRATGIVACIEDSMRMSRLFWVAVGFVGCALFTLGFLVGRA